MSWINSHTSFTTFSATKELKRLVIKTRVSDVPPPVRFSTQPGYMYEYRLLTLEFLQARIQFIQSEQCLKNIKAMDT